jgi:hypothetical protein
MDRSTPQFNRSLPAAAAERLRRGVFPAPLEPRGKRPIGDGRRRRAARRAGKGADA